MITEDKAICSQFIKTYISCFLEGRLFQGGYPYNDYGGHRLHHTIPSLFPPDRISNMCDMAENYVFKNL